MQRLPGRSGQGQEEDGETDERLFTMSAWRDTASFTDAESAALALTKAVTWLSDQADPVPDEIRDEAASQKTKSTWPHWSLDGMPYQQVDVRFRPLEHRRPGRAGQARPTPTTGVACTSTIWQTPGSDHRRHEGYPRIL
jgi:hypothetical protein